MELTVKLLISLGMLMNDLVVGLDEPFRTRLVAVISENGDCVVICVEL
jgi:hypothetical protein